MKEVGDLLAIPCLQEGSKDSTSKTQTQTGGSSSGHDGTVGGSGRAARTRAGAGAARSAGGASHASRGAQGGAGSGRVALATRATSTQRLGDNARGAGDHRDARETGRD